MHINGNNAPIDSGRAQTTGGPLALKDRAVDKQLIELEAAAKDLKDAGISARGRLEGGIFSVNVRHIQGAEAVHHQCRISEV